MTYEYHRARFEAARLRAELDDIAARETRKPWTPARSRHVDLALHRLDRAVDRMREGAA